MKNKFFEILFITLIFPLLLGWLGSWNRLMKSGHEAYMLQDYQKAVTAFQEAAVNRPNDPIVHHNLGAALYKQGKFQQAAHAFQTTLLKANVPKKAAVYYNLGNAQFQIRDYSAAITSYRSALKLNPLDDDTKHNLALALQQLATEKPNITQEQKANRPMQNSAKTEPNTLSKAEIDHILKLMSMNESKRRQQILKKQLNTGIRRAKDW